MKIFGLQIDNLNKKEVLRMVRQKAKRFSKTIESQDQTTKNKCFHIVTVNNEILVEAWKNQKYFQVLSRADLKIADSTGLMMASWFLKNRLKEKIPGSDLIFDLIKIAAKNNFSVYFLGAGPNVAQKTAKTFKAQYPELKIAGYSSDNPNSKNLIQKINARKPNFLLVCYGSPKQEFFIAHHKKNLRCGLAIGLGGTFDFVAGQKKRAPKIWGNLGLEWLWRLIIEPRRIKRIWRALFIFPILLLKYGQRPPRFDKKE